RSVSARRTPGVECFAEPPRKEADLRRESHGRGPAFSAPAFTGITAFIPTGSKGWKPLGDDTVTTRFMNKAGIVDSSRIVGTKVENPKGENLGKIESLMLDLGESRI